VPWVYPKFRRRKWRGKEYFNKAISSLNPVEQNISKFKYNTLVTPCWVGIKYVFRHESKIRQVVNTTIGWRLSGIIVL